ncbi:MAG: hypothetical protein Q9157_007635 [Trypethelium eluteriae]
MTTAWSPTLPKGTPRKRQTTRLFSLVERPALPLTPETAAVSPIATIQVGTTSSTVFVTLTSVTLTSVSTVVTLSSTVTPTSIKQACSQSSCSSTPAPTLSQPTETSKPSSGLSNGATAGIVIGVFFALSMLFCLFFWWWRRSGRTRRTSPTKKGWYSGILGTVSPLDNRINEKPELDDTGTMTAKKAELHGDAMVLELPSTQTPMNPVELPEDTVERESGQSSSGCIAAQRPPQRKQSSTSSTRHPWPAKMKSLPSAIPTPDLHSMGSHDELQGRTLVPAVSSDLVESGKQQSTIEGKTGELDNEEAKRRENYPKIRTNLKDRAEKTASRGMGNSLRTIAR